MLLVEMIDWRWNRLTRWSILSAAELQGDLNDELLHCGSSLWWLVPFHAVVVRAASPPNVLVLIIVFILGCIFGVFYCNSLLLVKFASLSCVVYRRHEQRDPRMFFHQAGHLSSARLKKRRHSKEQTSSPVEPMTNPLPCQPVINHIYAEAS